MKTTDNTGSRPTDKMRSGLADSLRSSAANSAGSSRITNGPRSRITGSKTSALPDHTQSRVIDSPAGPLELRADEHGLVSILFGAATAARTSASPSAAPASAHSASKGPAAAAPAVRPGAPERAASRAGGILDEAVRQLEEYFAGKRREFGLPLAPTGTEFQKAVWGALQQIPYGCTISYKTLAERIGRPAAVRAVGLANGRNPLPIVIPCHRVIGHDGSLTGYGGGLGIKRILLELERPGRSPAEGE